MPRARKPASKAQVVTLGNPDPKKYVVKYSTDEDDAAITNVYVSNAAVEEMGSPDEITVTIEAA